MNVESLVRKSIYNLQPYSCARDEFQGEASVYLDANESPYNSPYNRYPDPIQKDLKGRIAAIKKVRTEQIMLGNGSDEPIDLVIRIFCEPQEDNIVTIEPTYGMYLVCANINNVEYRRVLLDESFQLDAEKLLAATDTHTKVIFLCSPNNPSGNLLNRKEMLKVIERFNGIVVVDEAYIDFAEESSWLEELDKHPNLIILQTFSKAWGLASIRCGMAFASEEIISYFNKVKYPYNINILTQQFVSKQIDQVAQKDEWVKQILAQRTPFINELEQLPIVKGIYHSDANFLLVKVSDADAIYKHLVEQGIIVRNRNKVSLCLGCLRITIGTAKENKTLIEVLKQYKT